MDDPTLPEPSLDVAIKNQAAEVLDTAVLDALPLAGGSTSEVWQLVTARGSVLLKCRDLSGAVDAADGFFNTEAQGLNELSRVLQSSAGLSNGQITERSVQADIRVPEVYFSDEALILMEWLSPAKDIDKRRHFDDQLAEGLARLHQSETPGFGFHNNNYCGATTQLNQQMHDGYEFYATQRLLPQGKWARDKGILGHGHTMKLDRLAARLADYIPQQRAGLVHGDLWHGNVLCVENGIPAIIDPACYWGWPESDIAMTVLFGGFDAGFYQSYKAIIPSAEGFDERVPVYNLYHVLNHLNVFGVAYKSHVEAILDRFT